VRPSIICHSVCGPGQDSDIIFGSVSHLGWTASLVFRALLMLVFRQYPFMIRYNALRMHKILKHVPTTQSKTVVDFVRRNMQDNAG